MVTCSRDVFPTAAGACRKPLRRLCGPTFRRQRSAGDCTRRPLELDVGLVIGWNHPPKKMGTMTNSHSAPAAGYAVVLLAAGIIACDGSDSRVPTSPSGSPPAPSTTPPEVSDTLRGRVLDENDQPVAAAKITTRPGPLIAPVATFTAEDGRFTLTAPPQQYLSPPPQQNVWVGVDRDGYESGSYLAQ